MFAVLMILVAVAFTAGVLMAAAWSEGQSGGWLARREHLRALRSAKRLHDIAQQARQAMYDEATRFTGTKN
ncbi:MAG: hypothetical protein M3Q23_00205 [Actinomycetota bacterium]|nr:hypothetical protein [Actinomycetota bacterium]